ANANEIVLIVAELVGRPDRTGDDAVRRAYPVAHQICARISDALAVLVDGGAQAVRPPNLDGERPELIGDRDTRAPEPRADRSIAFEMIDRWHVVRRRRWSQTLAGRHEEHLRTLEIDDELTELIRDHLIELLVES